MGIFGDIACHAPLANLYTDWCLKLLCEIRSLPAADMMGDHVSSRRNWARGMGQLLQKRGSWCRPRLQAIAAEYHTKAADRTRNPRPARSTTPGRRLRKDKVMAGTAEVANLEPTMIESWESLDSADEMDMPQALRVTATAAIEHAAVTAVNSDELNEPPKRRVCTEQSRQTSSRTSVPLVVENSVAQDDENLQDSWDTWG